jgi:hypothetical protein
VASARRIGSIAILAALSAAGCTKTLRNSVSQPNPLLYPTETLRESEEIVIITGDMALERPRAPSSAGYASIQVMEKYPLVNKASFTVVTRDRLRFHVQLEHKWQEYVDVHNWHAYMIDDKGRRYEPVDIDRRQDRHIVETWDQEVRSARRNQFNDVIALNDDAHLDRRPLGNISVFRGFGDFVFYSEDIFHPEIESLTFVLERSGLQFHFTWKFTEDPTSVAAAGEP